MQFNYDKLKGRIIEKFRTRRAFARELRVSERTLSLKLNGKIFFSQYEINEIMKLLDISKTEIDTYFFTDEVQ